MESSVRNLMFDLAENKEIFAEDRKITNAEANDVIRKACFAKLGLSEKATDKEIRRALKKESAIEFFQVIEEVIERQIAYGWRTNEFFNTYVESRNLADGDRTDFWVDDDVILNVAKVSGDHHDLKYDRVCVA